MIVRGKRQWPPPERILFVQFRRIGDVLLCTPAIRAVAEHFPDAKIDFAVEPPCDEALWGHPRIDRLLVTPRGKSVREFLRFARQVREKKPDWVIDFFSNPRSAQLVFLTGAKTRIGLDRRGRRWAYNTRMVEEDADRGLYAVDLRLKILEHLNIPAAGRALEIYSDACDAQETERVQRKLSELPRGKPIVAVSTGNGNSQKLYPPDLTAEMINRLLDAGLAVVVTAGPGETALAEQALAGVKIPVPFIHGARVPTLAALYRKASIYVGPDSAPKHIAAACGLPTVSYFGGGRPENWTDAQDARHVMLIAPCDIRPHCSAEECARRECLRKIPPAELVRAVTGLLG